MWLFVLLVTVPIVEIALFIEVGGWIGLWPTIGIVIATAIAGAYLLRRQGIGAVADLQRSIEEGGDPRGPLAHGALILFSAALLLTPGFFTDAVGFALLFRPVRAAAISAIGSRLRAASTFRFSARVDVGGAPRRPQGPPPGGRGDVIEGDYEPIEKESRSAGETQRRPSDGRSGWTRGD